MRRFSQRNALVTLSDINITPLLDLAFVLLIIFVITTPLLENNMDLRLPEGGRAAAQRVDRDNIRNVEVNRKGQYLLGTNVHTIDQLEQTLVREYRANPELVIRIRADQESLARHFYPVIDRLTRNGITRLSLATEPAARR